MKIALWGFLGILVIIVAVMGVGAYWASSVKVDFKDPAVAGKFKETFAANCTATYQQRASKAGQPVAGDQLSKLDQACACWRDGVMPALAKRNPMTAMQLASVISSDPELRTIAHGCFTQAGIEDNL